MLYMKIKNILWLLARILTPIYLAFNALISENSKTALIISAIVATCFSIYTFLSDSSFKYDINKNIKHLLELNKNRKKELNRHKYTPHIVATAVIDVTQEPPYLVSSNDVYDVASCGLGDYIIIVLVKFNKHLVPKIESDCEFSPILEVSACGEDTHVRIKWIGKKPKKIYFSLISGNGYEGV
jgi:hypothetical protein